MCERETGGMVNMQDEEIVKVDKFKILGPTIQSAGRVNWIETSLRCDE